METRLPLAGPANERHLLTEPNHREPQLEQTAPTAMLLQGEPLEDTDSMLDEKIDEMVVRTYDRTHRFPGDARDKATRVKTAGFVDLEKFHDWRSALKRSMHRRQRQRQQRQQSNAAIDQEVNITQESRDLFQMMDFTRDLYKQTEYQFALNFEDPKQKSSMVGLTTGAECKEIGITAQGVKSQIVRPRRRAASKSTTRLSAFHQAKRGSLLGSSPRKLSSTMGREAADGSKQRQSGPIFQSSASTKFSSTKLRPYSSVVRLQRQTTENGEVGVQSGPVLTQGGPLSSQLYESAKQLDSYTLQNENNLDYAEKLIFNSPAHLPTASQQVVMDKTRRFLMLKPSKGRCKRQKTAETASQKSGQALRTSSGVGSKGTVSFQDQPQPQLDYARKVNFAGRGNSVPAAHNISAPDSIDDLGSQVIGVGAEFKVRPVPNYPMNEETQSSLSVLDQSLASKRSKKRAPLFQNPIKPEDLNEEQIEARKKLQRKIFQRKKAVVDDKKPFFSYHSQNLMKVRRPHVKADEKTEIVVPEQLNRTPRKFKEAGGDMADFLQPKSREAKQDSATMYLEHTESEVDEVGVAEAKEEERRKTQGGTTLDRAHSNLANALRRAYQMKAAQVDFEAGVAFDHLIGVSKRVDRTGRHKLEMALLSMVKKAATDEGVVREMARSQKRKREAMRDKARCHTLLMSRHDEQTPCVDLDKKQFLKELLKMFAHVEVYLRKKEFIALSNLGMAIAFLAVMIRQFNVAMKVYSMFGQIFLVNRQYRLANDFYNKLRNCAHSAQDIVVKMYAYKQMGHCFAKQEKYDEAIICFKHLIALAWTTNSPEAESAAYDALSIMHFYIGNIEKSKFYDHQFLSGLTEPETSQVRKITVTQTIGYHRWLEHKPNPYARNDDTLQGVKLAAHQAETVANFGSHLTSLFSETLKDFSLLKPDIVTQLESITRQFKEAREAGFHKEFENDPAGQYLHNCDPIEKDLLANKPELAKSSGNEAEKEKNELSKNQRLPSPSAAVNEKQKFKVVAADSEKQQWKPKGGPSVALHFQNKRRRVEDEERRLKLQEDKLKTVVQLAEERRKAGSTDFKDILARAQQYTQEPPTAKVAIGHLNRESKNEKLFEQVRQFQVTYDFEGLIREIFHEKKNIYVDPQGELLLRTATNSTSINQTTLEYQSRKQYKARIAEEKRIDAEKKHRAWLREQEEERARQMLEDIAREEREKKEKQEKLEKAKRDRDEGLVLIFKK